MKKKRNSVIEKTFFALLPVQIVMITVTSINSIIDGVIASNFVSATALAAIALFLPVLRILDTTNAIFLGGSQILCGQHIGRNQIKNAVSVYSTDILFIVLFGLATSFLSILFCRPIASLFVNDPTLIKELSDYIYGFAFGIVPMMLISQFTAFLQMEGQEKRTYIGMTVMIVLNITLDILFVSILKMGMFGLGLATTISNLAFLMILVSYYFMQEPAIRFDRKEICAKEIGNIVRVGFPGAVNQLGQALRSIFLNMIMLTYIGNVGVSAFGAVYSFGCVYWAVSGGVSTAVRVLASIYAGEEDRVGLHTIMKTALQKGTVLVCLVAALCVLCAPLFTRIFYGPDAGAVYNMTLAGFLLFPLTMPFSCICCVFSSYYQCLNRIKIVNILTFFDGLFGVTIFSCLLAPILGMNGVWLGHILSGVLTLLVILIYTVLYQKHLPHSISDLLVLDESFGVPESDRLNIQINDMKDVVSLSESVIAFSKNHGIDDHRSMLSGLCIEEMTGNIVQHGFDGRKDYCIDVHVVYKNNGLLLRIKDNCKTFNPTEVQNILDPEDLTQGIGLRLVTQAAETMSYNNCLGINILTITL